MIQVARTHEYTESLDIGSEDVHKLRVGCEVGSTAWRELTAAFAAVCTAPTERARIEALVDLDLGGKDGIRCNMLVTAVNTDYSTMRATFEMRGIGDIGAKLGRPWLS